MNRLTLSAFAVAAGLGLLSTAAFAGTITDNYWGADDHGYQDVIGEANLFGISSADISRSGNEVSVIIHASFGPATGLGTFKPYTTNGQGIGFGDLFLSTAWNPIGSSADHYINDDAANGTHWTYGFALDNEWSTTGGNGTLYKLNGSTNDDNALLSQDFIKNAIYRNGQEVAVDTGSSTVADTGDIGTWTITDNSPGTPRYDIGFTFDASGTDLANSDFIAIHWAPTCANDVIEGQVAVPRVDEPAPLGLLLTGSLLAFGGLRRRRRGVN